MMLPSEEALSQRGTDQKSQKENKERSEPALHGLTERVEVLEMMANAVNQVKKRLESEEAQQAERNLIDIKQAFNFGHNRYFICGTLKLAARDVI